MPSRIRPKKLLVEGKTDLRVIPYLLQANGVERKVAGEPVVHIKAYDGIDKMLKQGAIEGELAASGLEALGTVVDANGDARKQWARVRDLCLPQIPHLPPDIPAEGLRVATPNGLRFGVWIMPDNRLTGALEDFLVQLVPIEAEGLFDLAKHCVQEAGTLGAPLKDVQRTKARIHTWLAWQDEPCRSLHQAVDHHVLDPQKPESAPFVRWFRNLFSL